tara:strand:+ start:1426 stop:1875 length:450 start_codon:yes stop_codon:yes gene_type:complete
MQNGREYRSTQFSSRCARAPSHWGGATWDALFLLASDYPHTKQCEDDDAFDAATRDARRRAWKTLLTTLPQVLACGVCAEHFKRHVHRDGGRSLDRALQDREALFRFLYRCKDEVNRRSGRSSPSFETVEKRYIPRCRPPRSRPSRRRR